MGSRRSTERVAALTGVAAVAVGVAALLISGEPPDATEPAPRIVAYYVEGRAAAITGAALTGAAGLLLIFFGAYLRAALGAAEGPGGFLATGALVGLATMAVGLAIDATITIALADGAGSLAPAAVQALQALWDNDFVPIALGTTAFLLSAGISIARHGPLPGWLGWVAIALGVLGLTPLGFYSFLGAAAWIAGVSVLLALRPRPIA
jgi:hypothetical protein